MNIEQIEYTPALLGYELEHIRKQIEWSKRRRNEMEAKQARLAEQRLARQRAAEYQAVRNMRGEEVVG